MLVKKVKLTELENKIPDISSLATKTALTTVENQIPDVSDLVNKTDYNTKVTKIKINKLTADVFNARIAQANLIIKTNFDAKLSNLKRNITANKSKHLLVENELSKLKPFDSSCFIGKSHFEEDGVQRYLVFQPIIKCFKVISNTNYISSPKSKWLSPESIKPPTTSDNSLTPELSYYGKK